MIYERYANLKYIYSNRHSLHRGYYVSLDEGIKISVFRKNDFYNKKLDMYKIFVNI